MAVAPCKRLVLKLFPDLLVPILKVMFNFRQCWVLGCWPRGMNPGGVSFCGSNRCFTMQIEFENKFSQIGKRGLGMIGMNLPGAMEIEPSPFGRRNGS